jgi:hypothetical protein
MIYLIETAENRWPINIINKNNNPIYNERYLIAKSLREYFVQSIHNDLTGIWLSGYILQTQNCNIEDILI